MCIRDSIYKFRSFLEPIYYSLRPELTTAYVIFPAEILKKNDDPIAKHTIKFYQSCIDKSMQKFSITFLLVRKVNKTLFCLHLERKLNAGLTFYISLVKQIFDGFDLWN